MLLLLSQENSWKSYGSATTAYIIIFLSVDCSQALIHSMCSTASVSERAKISTHVRNSQHCDQWGKTSYKAQMTTAGVYSEDYSHFFFSPSLIVIMWYEVFCLSLVSWMRREHILLSFHVTELFNSFYWGFFSLDFSLSYSP